MLIRAGYDIAYQCTQPTPMLLTLHVRPERHADLRSPENFAVTPWVPYRTYRDSFGNVCTRLVAPAGVTHFTCDFVTFDSGLHEVAPEGARRVPVEDLPDDVLIFLLGSRYCETDKLTDLAWSYFGHVAPGWDCVKAISQYAHERIRFDYKQARPDRSAADANYERVGVCRDYAHLAIALCRCMNIPARYCTGYLGDIGVPLDPNPMDFSAWFEVYLEGRWHSWDARHNHPRIGRILMARGRDATDAALSTAFGSATLVNFTIMTDEIAAA
ncbi:MAG TPA: transglutaminase family protein [Rhizomicrobium sp.]